MSVWYATREAVKAAVDVKNSARANAQIDRAIADASRSADRLCRRVFYPRVKSQRFDWPDDDRPTPWRLWLGGDSELISLTSVATGGTAVPLSSVLLYPDYGPPFTRLELNRSSAGGFTIASTPQKAIDVAGLFGYGDDARSAGSLLGAIDAAQTSFAVADSSLFGVGTMLRLDAERMIVTERTALNTNITLAAPGLTAQMNATAVPLSTVVGAPVTGEVIAIDGERMLVQETIGTTCYVTRQVDGTVLAAHTAGTSIYAYRTVVVSRGAVGTTAAAHTLGTVTTCYVPPSPVTGLVVAEALNQVAQENSAYARVIGSGDGQREARGAGLKDKRDQVRKLYGRMVRMGAV